MFDLHMTHVINNGIRYYSKDRSLFDALFPHTGEAYKARMFEWLQNNKVSFDIAYSGKTTKKLPLITVELNEALYDSQGLGNASFERLSTDGQYSIRYAHEFTSQECRVNIYTDEIEVLRLLHQIVKASMLLFQTSLLNAGYQNIMYLGTSSLAPEVDLAGEGSASVYGRQCMYAALHLLELPMQVQDLTNLGANPPLYDIQIQNAIYSANDLPSGVAGGVIVES